LPIAEPQFGGDSKYILQSTFGHLVFPAAGAAFGIGPTDGRPRRPSARTRSVMADLVAGRQPYTTLRRRLIRTFDWRLAWRMVRN